MSFSNVVKPNDLLLEVEDFVMVPSPTGPSSALSALQVTASATNGVLNVIKNTAILVEAIIPSSDSLTKSWGAITSTTSNVWFMTSGVVKSLNLFAVKALNKSFTQTVDSQIPKGIELAERTNHESDNGIQETSPITLLPTGSIVTDQRLHENSSDHSNLEEDRFEEILSSSEPDPEKVSAAFRWVKTQVNLDIPRGTNVFVDDDKARNETADAIVGKLDQLKLSNIQKFRILSFCHQGGISHIYNNYLTVLQVPVQVKGYKTTVCIYSSQHSVVITFSELDIVGSDQKHIDPNFLYTDKLIYNYDEDKYSVIRLANPRPDLGIVIK